MKPKVCGILSLLLLGVYGLNGLVYAQDPAKDDLRYEITAFLGKFADAVNRTDTRTVGDMVSTRPQVSWIADGEILQGSGDIRSHVEWLLRHTDRYRIEFGTMSIADVNGLALATGSYTLRRRGGDSSVAFRGAVTFLMEKQGRDQSLLHRRSGHWVLVHLHRSTAALKPLTD